MRKIIADKIRGAMKDASSMRSSLRRRRTSPMQGLRGSYAAHDTPSPCDGHPDRRRRRFLFGVAWKPRDREEPPDTPLTVGGRFLDDANEGSG